MSQVIRQGDIVFFPREEPVTEEALTGATKLSDGADYVVAEGEHTGHKHVLRGNSDFFDVFKLTDEEDPIAVFHRDTLLEHDEHAPLTIPAGTYDIGHEEETDWLAINAAAQASEQRRRVAD